MAGCHLVETNQASNQSFYSIIKRHRAVRIWRYINLPAFIIIIYYYYKVTSCRLGTSGRHAHATASHLQLLAFQGYFLPKKFHFKYKY